MRGAIALITALLLAPLLLVDVPPLVDYPNHLARLFLLARGQADPILAPMFTVHWGVIPNLAIDLAGPPLLLLLPVHIAGRVLLAILLVLPFAGVLALNRAIFGRVQPWALASALLMPSGAFLLGFLNFIAGLGAALLLAAFWIAGRRHHPSATIALASLATGVLFFCHLMGVIFALALIFAWEARSWRGLRAASPLILLPASLYLAAPLGTVAGAPEYLPLADKLRQLLAPFAAYDARLDLTTALAIATFLALCALRRHLEIPPGIRLALAGFTALYAAAPYAWKGTQSLDTRFVFMAVLTLFAGIRPRNLPPWLTLAATATFTTLFLARTALLSTAWHAHATDLAQLRTTIASVTPGEKIYVASVAPTEAPAYWSTAPLSRRLSNTIRTDTHLPALLLIERRAFWPLLFDEPSQQPVLLTPSYQTLADHNGGLVDHRSLNPATLCGYDRLLLLGAGGDPGFTTPNLLPEVKTDAAALYAIRKDTLRCD
jgi:hypothetical protein